jgi:hypothetical protein
MKKLLVFLTFLFFCLLLAGCGKEEPTVPVDPPIVITDTLKISMITFNPEDFAALNDGVAIVSLFVKSNADFIDVEVSPTGLNEKTTHHFEGGDIDENFPISEKTDFMLVFSKNDSIFRIGQTIDVYQVVIPPIPPSLYAKALPSIIEYGTSTIIKVEKLGEGLIDSIHSDLPGFTGEYGEFQTPSLTETTTYHFTAYGPGGQCNVVVVVTVIPLPTRTEILCSAPLWFPDSIWYFNYSEESWVYSEPYNNIIYTQSIIFYPNGIIEVYRFPEGYFLGVDSWYFEGEFNIYWPYEMKYIKELNTEIFIVEY